MHYEVVAMFVPFLRVFVHYLDLSQFRLVKECQYIIHKIDSKLFLSYVVLFQLERGYMFALQILF
jgi:hypothetical protein